MEQKKLFEVGKKYTLYRMSFLASTVMSEIKVTELDPEGNPVYQMRNGRKRLLLKLFTRQYESAPLKPFSGAVFEGWDQPIKCDSETTTFRGNACFNFVADPLEVRAWMESGQLNPVFEKYRVLACGRDNNEEEMVYPELYEGGHAVLDRILDKKEVANVTE